jgi:hypothetical protein
MNMRNEKWAFLGNKFFGGLFFVGWEVGLNETIWIQRWLKLPG